MFYVSVTNISQVLRFKTQNIKQSGPGNDVRGASETLEGQISKKNNAQDPETRKFLRNKYYDSLPPPIHRNMRQSVLSNIYTQS